MLPGGVTRQPARPRAGAPHLAAPSPTLERVKERVKERVHGAGRGASDEAARDGWHAGKVGEGGMGLNKVQLTN